MTCSGFGEKWSHFRYILVVEQKKTCWWTGCGMCERKEWHSNEMEKIVGGWYGPNRGILKMKWDYASCMSFLWLLQWIPTNLVVTNNTSYYLVVLEIISPKSVTPRHSRGVTGLEVPGENPFLAFAGILRLPVFLGSWPLPPPSKRFAPTFAFVISSLWSWRSCLPLILALVITLGSPK